MSRTRFLPLLALALTACDADSTTPVETTPRSTDAVVPPDTGEAFDPFEGAFAPADLSDPATTRLLSYGSAPGAYQFAILPLNTANDNGDPGCPATTSGKDGTLLTGGCTALDGREWFGTAAAGATGVGTEVEYLNFGFREPALCTGGTESQVFSVTWNGLVNVRSDPTSYSVDVRLTERLPDLDACTAEILELASIYEGSVDGVGTQTVWNGAGVFGFTDNGWAEAVTVDEVYDETVCDTEALSGTTALTSAGSEAVLVYDGVTDCSPSGTVTWTLNGVDQGVLSGVTCSTGGAPAAGWGLLAGLFLLGRRRARR